MGEKLSADSLTPAMRQYKKLKQKYPDCLLLFRMGDFYEMFYEDAIIASKVLGITLTSRGKGVKKAPLAGIPIRAANTYIQRLINNGLKLAIAEQIEDPRTVKGRVVARDVVRVITPGTVIEEGLLDSRTNNYIAALYAHNESYGIAFADITTGDFFSCETEDSNRMIAELKKTKPVECVIPETLAVNNELIDFLQKENVFISQYDDTHFSSEEAKHTLELQFGKNVLDGFGITKRELQLRAAGALLSYIRENQKQSLKHINRIYSININDYMELDPVTIRNLEIFENIVDKTAKNTLIKVIDRTTTAMGSRLLKRWLQRPLLELERIRKRQQAIETLLKKPIVKEELREVLKNCCDIDRLIGKLNYGTLMPKDMVALANTLEIIPKISTKLKELSGFFSELAELPALTELLDEIRRAIKEDPPNKITEGSVIKRGYNRELDELWELKDSSKEILKRMELQEIAKTGIKTLRIGFNQVLGYYIQVSKSYINKVPSYYIKKQTLVNGERFVTKELKALESKILGAEERINILEYELFKQLTVRVESKLRELQLIAKRIALLDVLCSMAEVAEKNNYCKPEVNTSGRIIIKAGRHPIVEQLEQEFIPNDTELAPNEMIILTGPNMAGKSTYMRQVCLITLLAQIGSFVPAKSAQIGVVDRIFTRVGAYDDLAHGQSTFMVEMLETANILNNATENSLIILDEIGRGTSTFDGVAIAWAVAEYIYSKLKAKTIFATHYHVLNKLEEELRNIKNYNIAVKEIEEGILFLRKIQPGGTDKSYGIHVAKLAGMPAAVIERALEIQQKLTEEDKMLDKLKAKRDAKQFTLKQWER